ncbi:protein ASPARTIC PROTEASE IN GUARD CELL 1 [Diospyros lotus]|uniref:protein ASPARTIC PROTEASE IN GUARD CELL 1 n=1 Tax=Diospyros lotus TaxID=55363 RepID=UPI00224E9C05|nr:protein ASPARTIC PROTEASE IN GUARD CELL 1 [Diospyros lotus]
MAENAAFSFLLTHILLVSALFFRHSFAASRSVDWPFTTTVFDVSASIQGTRQVLSFDPQSFQEVPTITQTTTTTTSSFSVSVHPRSALHRPTHKDYKALTLSRLARDSARLNFIRLNIEFAINGFNTSHLRPEKTTTVFRPEDFQSPLTSGVRMGSGEYFSRLGVGRPAKDYYMVVDTGSDVSWLQCLACTDCYQQSDPIFDPSKSSSYRSLPCGSPECQALQDKACRAGQCLYEVSYGDGSFTVGNFATETLTFGSSGSANNVAIGCGHDNEGLFVASAGLLGLGGGPLSLTSQLKATSFSYCLVDRDSSASSTLEFNAALPGGSVTAQLLRNPRVRTYRYVDFTGISVGGHSLNLPESLFAVDEAGHGGVIVDSGTAVTRLNSQAYDSLRDAFRSMTQHLPRSGGISIFDTCYDLSAYRKVAIPEVAFLFPGGKKLALPAKNTIVPVDESGTVCLAFAATDFPISIIGNVQQQGTRVSYDMANSVIGFAPHNC